MKELLAVISLVLSGVVAEAPYPPSGFRPNGPAFELPQKVSQTQNNQQYLPPVDPRIPSTQYGFPEEDVSVQGLPVSEQRPVFQVSPINGQQYVGPEFNTDIKNLDDSYRQSQYQLQQQQYREFERQRQLEAAQSRARTNQVTPQVPRQFGTDAPTTEATFKTTEMTTEVTTESDLNEGEVESKDKKEKVTVEFSRQNLQEYPGEFFLNALAQLQLQPQAVPFGQIRAPLYFQPIQQETQKQVAGFDAPTHFAALPSVLAQQQYIQGLQAQGFVNPALQQQVVVSGQDPNVAFVAANPQPIIGNQYQPAVATGQDSNVGFVAQNPQFQGFQPAQSSQFPSQYQPQAQNPQTVAVQQQSQSKQNDYEDDSQNNKDQPQFVYQQSYQPQEVAYAPQPMGQYQPQPQSFQPQGVIYQAPSQLAPASQYQPQEQQPMLLQAPQAQYQPQQSFLPQAQLVDYQALVQQYQGGLAPQYPSLQQQFPAQQQQFPAQQQQFPAQQQYPGQQQYPQQARQPDALQSGLDVNQQGNGVEPNEDDDDENQDDGSTSVAVATAFGTRTQPRMFTRYGAPAPLPRASANPQPTAEPAADETTEGSGAAVAEANAFAGRRKNSKLRSRRVRPVFTLDRSGHLVLAQEQN